MYSFYIVHKVTNELEIIFGYTWNNAVHRSGINPDEWNITIMEYED